jgi:hypothetical protein
MIYREYILRGTFTPNMDINQDYRLGSTVCLRLFQKVQSIL